MDSFREEIPETIYAIDDASAASAEAEEGLPALLGRELLSGLSCRNLSRCSSKSFNTFVEGASGPEAFLVAGVVLSRTNRSDVEKYSVIEQACWNRICSLADLLFIGFAFT